MTVKNLISLFAIVFLFSFSALHAQEHHEEHKGDDSHAEHHVSKNHAALFLGSTTNLDHEISLFTVGLDYEYRLPFAHNMFGIGLVGEFLTGENEKEIVLGIPIFVHAAAGLKFNVAPLMAFAEAVEHNAEEKSGSTEETTDEGRSSHFGFRAGVAYDIHVGKFSISPTVNADFINESTALAYGIAFGIGF